MNTGRFLTTDYRQTGHRPEIARRPGLVWSKIMRRLRPNGGNGVKAANGCRPAKA